MDFGSFVLLDYLAIITEKSKGVIRILAGFYKDIADRKTNEKD